MLHILILSLLWCHLCIFIFKMCYGKSTISTPSILYRRGLSEEDYTPEFWMTPSHSNYPTLTTTTYAHTENGTLKKPGTNRIFLEDPWRSILITLSIKPLFHWWYEITKGTRFFFPFFFYETWSFIDMIERVYFSNTRNIIWKKVLQLKDKIK